uniref:Uncharacterized protein n=1 Tax=Panagrolaimus sp. JU765 TaxID=591449 RepID=A0AC34PV34_9BILA
MLTNGTFLTPHRAQLYVPQLYSGSSDANEQVLSNITQIIPYFAVQQPLQQNPLISMYAPINVPINFIPEQGQSYYHSNSDELFNESTASEDLTTSDKEMSPHEVKTSASSSSMTSCSTVTPDLYPLTAINTVLFVFQYVLTPNDQGFFYAMILKVLQACLFSRICPKTPTHSSALGLKKRV